MKKFSVFFALLFVAAATFVGCKKEDEVFPAPTITFSGGDAGNGSVELDFASVTSISKTFVVQVAAEGEINTFTLSKKVYGTSTVSTPITITGDYSGKTTFDYTFNQTFTATDFDNVTKIEYIFTCTDKQATPLTAEKIFTVTKKAGVVTTPFTQTKTGQFYHIAGANGCTGAYDLVNDLDMGSAATEANKDMKNTDVAGATFTGAWTQGTGNTTQFVKANTYDYANATVESATTAFTNGTVLTTVTPANNDIYIVKLRNNNYAVLKVTSIAPLDVTCNASTTNKGKISFEYKK